MTGGPARRIATICLTCVLSAAAGARPQENPEVEVLGKPSAFSADAWDQETIGLDAGVALLARPEREAEVILTLDAASELPLIERREGWALVRFGSRKGWVLEDLEALDLARGFAGTESGGPDAARLDQARSFLGGEPIDASLGAWDLITDLMDSNLLASLAITADDVVSAYESRFGLDPGPNRGETIVLFASEEDYRRFEHEVSGIGGLGTMGHTSGGMVVAFTGDRRMDEIRQILVHELTHVLNQRALAADLPPWLEEGMADDLAFSGFDETGRLLVGTLGGASSVESDIDSSSLEPSYYLVDLVGPHGALFGLLSDWDDPVRPPLESLVELPWAEFVRPERRRVYYAESAFLVRFLLDGLRGGLADAFRSYLAAIASGELAEASTIWSYLGATGTEVELPLYTWLRSQATANGVPLPGG